MTAERKIQALIGALLLLNGAIAFWGARDIFSGLYDPIIRALGA